LAGGKELNTAYLHLLRSLAPHFVLVLVAAAEVPGLAVDARIPRISLPDQNGVTQTFDSLKGPKGAMLVFYRSADWCAYCKSQLVGLEEMREQLKGRGFGLAAISYDAVPVLRNFADRKKIHFPLLSDVDSQVIRAFGILDEFPPKNTPFFGVPHPVTYLVDERGVIISRHSDEDYRQRHTVSNILIEKFDIRTGASEMQVRTPHLTLKASASDARTHGGERLRLIIDAELNSGMHVYAPGVADYIPVQWSLTESPAYQSLPPKFPASRNMHLEAINETVPVYEGRFSVQREVIIPAATQLKPSSEGGGEIVITGSCRYQACDEKKCYLPETIPLTWKLRVEPHDSTRVPVELQRRAPGNGPAK
jgi:peroxiredoxin